MNGIKKAILFVLGTIVATLIALYLTRDLIDSALASVLLWSFSHYIPNWAFLFLSFLVLCLITQVFIDRVYIDRLRQQLKGETSASLRLPAGKPGTLENVQLALSMLRLSQHEVTTLQWVAHFYEDGKKCTSIAMADQWGKSRLWIEQGLHSLLEKGLVEDVHAVRGTHFLLTSAGREWLLAHMPA